MEEPRLPGLLGMLLATVVVLGHSGCTSTIEPPSDPRDPVTVFLRKEARHKALLLPGEIGGFVEYGFGDYDWYALRKDRWYHAFDTVLWPTKGTLGRKSLAAIDVAGLQAHYPYSTLFPIVVGGDEATRLRRRLAEQYADHGDGEIYNHTYDLFFVEHDDRFWFLHNCHDAMAAWLRELGCSVSFAPVRVGLSFEPSEGVPESR